MSPPRRSHDNVVASAVARRISSFIVVPPKKLRPAELHAALNRYLRSGWAFLVPYVAAYALFAAMGWPIHPSAGFPLSLLHVYWVLHAGNALAAVALLWRCGRTLCRRPARLLPTLGWSCAALLFFVSGAYLEFPADPWTHYARINEWHSVDSVAAHSAGLKATYFLAYSLFGWVRAPRFELLALDLFHAACCLLLMWQYFLLGRATRLPRRAAFVFALLTTVTLGNNLFGFYRYYGISSSVFAQIGFIAATRSFISLGRNWISGAHPWPTPAAIAPTGWAMGAAALVVAFTHAQALAFMAVAAGAVLFWALYSRYGFAALAWIAGLLLFACIATATGLDRGAGADDWLTRWGGFAIFFPGSAAAMRALEILGAVGLLNLAAGVVLLCRNHVVGWLTAFPIIALSLPCVALPLFAVLEPTESVPMFHRVLLSIPVPLALVWLGLEVAAVRSDAGGPRESGLARLVREQGPYLVTLAVLVFLVSAPATRPIFNRFFHSSERSNVGTAWQAVSPATQTVLRESPPDQQWIGPPNARFICDALGLTFLHHTTRDFTASLRVEATAADIARVHDYTPKLRLLLVRPEASVSPTSFAGYLSRHWPAQALALESAGYDEFRRLAEAQRGEPEGAGSLEIVRFDRR